MPFTVFFNKGDRPILETTFDDDSWWTNEVLEHLRSTFKVSGGALYFDERPIRGSLQPGQGYQFINFEIAQQQGKYRTPIELSNKLYFSSGYLFYSRWYFCLEFYFSNNMKKAWFCLFYFFCVFVFVLN